MTQGINRPVLSANDRQYRMNHDPAYYVPSTVNCPPDSSMESTVYDMSSRKFSGKTLLLLACFTMLSFFVTAQEKKAVQSTDSLKTVTTAIDTTAPGDKKGKKVNVYDPKKAARRSALIPGWGQVYNKKYWKVPIVYGALGVTAGIFFSNLDTYKDTRDAYTAKYNYRQPGATPADTMAYNNIPDYLKPISEGSLRSYRDTYRRYIDYSVLFFVLFWGLNVVDAAVDAHLKSFDVSPDLSFRFNPGYSEMAGTTGFNFVVSLEKKKTRALLPSRF